MAGMAVDRGRTSGVDDVAQQSRIFEIPIDLGRPDELLRRITGWVGAGGRAAARDVRQRARAQPVARAPRAARRARATPTSSTATATASALAAKALDVEIPHRMTGADWIWGARRAVRGRAGSRSTCSAPSPGSPREAGRAAARAGTRGCEIAGTHHGYFEIGSPARRPRRRGHQRAPAGHPARRAWARPKQELWVQQQRRPPRRRRAVDRRRAVRLRLGPRPARPGLVGRQWPGMDLPTRRSSRSGCGAATCWATRCSCRRVMAQARAAPTPPSADAPPGASAPSPRALGDRRAAHRPLRATCAGLGARCRTLRAAARGVAACALFGVAGFGAGAAAAAGGLRRHELLWVLPVGACAIGARA